MCFAPPVLVNESSTQETRGGSSSGWTTGPGKRGENDSGGRVEDGVSSVLKLTAGRQRMERRWRRNREEGGVKIAIESLHVCSSVCAV